MYNIIGDLKLEITVTSNPFDIPLDRLFSMAARINKKRSFLFVSKVLGKHIPVNPHLSLLSGTSLALLFTRSMGGEVPERYIELAIQGLVDPSTAKKAYEEIMSSKVKAPYPVTCIGFAETATAIGHSVYHTLGSPCSYIHTSREQIVELPSLLHFEEEHSHAVSHRCYARKQHYVAGKDAIVLVDDEITTGKTSLNIIRDIHGKFPRKQYYVLSLLDWRTGEEQRQYDELEQELGVKIITLALVKGIIKETGTAPAIAVEGTNETVSSVEVMDTAVRVMFLDSFFEHVHVSSIDGHGSSNDAPYLTYSGRFGLDTEDNSSLDASISRAAAYLAKTREGASTLCMGTGEFMYIPMRIAAEMGEGVLYQSTTRSPIHPSAEEQYAVRSKYSYPSPEDPAVTNYIYNVAPGMYDELYFFMEREVPPILLRPLIDIWRTLKFKRVHVVFCSPQQYDWEEMEQL